MNFFDIIFSLIIIIFIFLGASKGAFREFISTLGIILGYYAAERFHTRYMGFTLEYVSNDAQARVVTYFAIFAAFVLAGIILSSLVKAFISFKRPTLLSRVFGALLGLTKALLICLLIFFIVEGYISSYLDDLYNSLYTPWLQNLRSLVNGIKFAFIDNINPV
jgi:membrane protein required for colicin V production